MQGVKDNRQVREKRRLPSLAVLLPPGHVHQKGTNVLLQPINKVSLRSHQGTQLNHYQSNKSNSDLL